MIAWTRRAIAAATIIGVDFRGGGKTMLRRLIVLVLLTWLPLAASAQDSKSEPAGNTLRGAVHDAQGQPVVGAWLEVRATPSGAISATAFEGAPFQSMRSGPNGRWAFEGLPAGTWLLTVVAKTEPTPEGAAPPSDEEFQKMARPGADYRVPENVALTRIIRHFEAGQAATNEPMDLGLALGPRPARPLLGQLVGAFHPDTFGYEVRLVRGTQLPGGGSMSGSVTMVGAGTVTSTSETINSGTGATTTSSTTMVDGVSDPPNPRFCVVPDREGFFDFGSLDVKDEDFVSVEAFPLAGGGATTGDTVFGAPIGTFEPWPLGIEIAIVAHHTVTLRAARSDGTPLADKAWVQGNLWSEESVSTTAPLAKSGWKVELTEGTYVARATLDQTASALTAFTVDAKGPSEVTLLLQPCPPFTVRFVDAQGAPLGDFILTFGTEATKGFPVPCRVPAMCMAGEVSLKGILPGSYDVEFKADRKEPFTRRLELKPDGVPITVTLP